MTIKDRIERRAKLHEDCKSIWNKADNEKRDLTAEERESVKKLDGEMRSLQKEIDDIVVNQEEDRALRSAHEERERQLAESRGRKTHTEMRDSAAEPTALERDLAFRGWILGKNATPEMRTAAQRCNVSIDRSFIDMAAIRTWDQAGREVRAYVPVQCDAHGNIVEQRSALESRALSSGTTTAGGDSIPTAMMQAYAEVKKWNARIDLIANVLNTENGQNLPYPTVTDTANSGRILGEGTTATTTTDPTFSKITLGAYKISSDAVAVPWELLMDSFMDLSSWLGEALGRRVGRKRNNEFTVGAGTTEPKGLITACATGKTAAVTNAFTMDETIDLEHSVDPAYRPLPGTGFMCHDTIAAYLRKLKDGQGRYYWEPSLQLGQPDRFRGYPVYINNDMASALTTGQKLLGFGNVKQALVVRNAGAARFIRDESIYVKEHMTYFEALERADSNVVDTTAFKVLALG